MSANPFGRVLAVCALLGPALGYVQFREQIPNALNIEETLGAGHVSRGGGGEVNAFGSAFRDADFLWTLDLCAADSDGDGESNGLELGDPCCVWLPGATPARNWGVSHPGEKRSASGVKMPPCSETVRGRTEEAGKEAFWVFYFANPFVETETAEGEKAPSAWESMRASVPTSWAELRAVLPSEFTLDMQGGAGGVKNLFTGGLVLLGLVFLGPGGAWRKARAMSWKQHAVMALASFLYTDMLSALLHVTLDNPQLNDWPVVGREAQSFQGHHYDPSAITRGGWWQFLQLVHSGQLAICLTFLLHCWGGGADTLKLFLLYQQVAMPGMMAGHRWSHCLPSRLPAIVAWAHRWGILVSPEHHSQHHAYFDRNFAILSGVTDPITNFLTGPHGMHPHNTSWAFVFLAYGALPSLLSWLPVSPFRVAARDKVKDH